MIRKIIFLFLICSVLSFAVEQKELDDIIKLLNSGQNDTAITILKSIGGDNEILLAIAYLGKKDFVNAQNYALKSFSKNSNNVVTNYILAQIYEHQSDYATAMKYWDNVYHNAKDKAVKMQAKKHYGVLKVLVK